MVWIADMMLQMAAAKSDRDASPCDAAYLSAAYAAIDAQSSPLAAQRETADRLRSLHRAWLLAPRRLRTSTGLGTVFEFDPLRWRTEAETPPTVLILSPNPFSLYTLSVLQLCLRYRVPVAGVLLRAFTVRRVMDELRRDGLQLLLSKIWRKLVLRADENADSGPLSLRDVLGALGASGADARVLAKENGIPVHSCAEFDDPESLDWVRTLGAEMALFTGGGLIKPTLQSLLPLGIINTHMGHLPDYKGMDVVEWPILNGDLRSVGATTHVMDAGLDTGPVLQRLDVDPTGFASLGQLRNTVGALMPLVCFDSALGLKSGRLPPLPQADGGRQYYFVHDAIHPLIDEVIGALPQDQRARAQAPVVAIKQRLSSL